MSSVSCSLISRTAAHIETIQKPTFLKVSKIIKNRNPDDSLYRQFLEVIRVLKVGGGPSC